MLLDNMIVCYCGEDSDDFGDYEDSGDGNGEDGDIYITMQCLSVCLSRKMSTPSWESPVTTCHHPYPLYNSRLLFMVPCRLLKVFKG